VSIERVLTARERSIGAFTVGRVLPTIARRAVGPFVLLDHMGPIDLLPGEAADVLPHPHIGLATLTYLFEGSIDHRDSLGSHQLIRPGEINWMSAGRGIVHSERMTQEAKESGIRLHGLQLWVALPEDAEESEPAFHHHSADLPSLERSGARLRVLAGSAFGVTSPVPVSAPLFYVEAHLPAGAILPWPDHPERAAYVIDGQLGGHGPKNLIVIDAGDAPELRADRDARVMLIGGTYVGHRHMWWNFVSSDPRRIEDAKLRWKERRFPAIPGDDQEFVEGP
jgi:redox-sensitive bicupin YhaK (pirin superfamily)